MLVMTSCRVLASKNKLPGVCCVSYLVFIASCQVLCCSLRAIRYNSNGYRETAMLQKFGDFFGTGCLIQAVRYNISIQYLANVANCSAHVKSVLSILSSELGASS